MDGQEYFHVIRSTQYTLIVVLFILCIKILYYSQTLYGKSPSTFLLYKFVTMVSGPKISLATPSHLHPQHAKDLRYWTQWSVYVTQYQIQKYDLVLRAFAASPKRVQQLSCFRTRKNALCYLWALCVRLRFRTTELN